MTAKLIAFLLAATAALPGWGQSPSQPQAQDHFVVTAHQVARTLADRGMFIADDKVSLLANVAATEPNPGLDILSVKPWGSGASGPQSGPRSLVELACHSPGACLPFYAVVTGMEQSAKTAAAASASHPVSANTRPAAFNAIMRAGTHATLIMEDKRSHVQLSVISLENGKAGDKIHVTSPDHKQVYTAEVVNANLLKRSY